jgi:hypothetical protein
MIKAIKAVVVSSLWSAFAGCLRPSLPALYVKGQGFRN